MDWLLERFSSARDRVAFVHEGREVSFGEVLALVESFRTRLTHEGVAGGDRVVVVSDYSPEVFCLMLALAELRCIVIPLSRQSVVEQRVALGISGCEWNVEFDALGVTATFTRHNVVVEHELLTGLRERKAPGLVLFSSGSSGAPKAIVHDFDRVAEKFRVQRQAVVAIPFLMIDHFGGINTILAITSSLGTVVTVTDRSVAGICGAIQKYRVELLPATPSFLTLLMATNISREFDLSSLRRITYGTEVMPQSTLDRVRAAFPGVELQQTYGLSEVGVLRSQSRGDGSLWVRVGGGGFQTKVVDGILWIKSEFAMLGYLNAPSNFDADGWFNTQDQVEVDGEYFRILGRVTDLINVGGQKVYPAEVESVILELSNVRDVAVFGERHSLLGNIVVANVVLETPEPVDALKKRVRQACLARLAAYKVPARVTISQAELHNARHKKVRRASGGPGRE